jgi:hypothetical protein
LKSCTGSDYFVPAMIPLHVHFLYDGYFLTLAAHLEPAAYGGRPIGTKRYAPQSGPLYVPIEGCSHISQVDMVYPGF